MKEQPRPRMRLVPGADEPRVRWARVATARARIAAGYYDRDEIRERLLDAILEELQP